MRISDWSSDVCSSDLTTGESPTVSHDEHKRVVELCVEAANGRVPVIAGTGSNSTAEAIDFTAHAKQAGDDAADRKSVVEGKSVSVRVDLGGRRIINTKKKKHTNMQKENT